MQPRLRGAWQSDLSSLFSCVFSFNWCVCESALRRAWHVGHCFLGAQLLRGEGAQRGVRAAVRGSCVRHAPSCHGPNARADPSLRRCGFERCNRRVSNSALARILQPAGGRFCSALEAPRIDSKRGSSFERERTGRSALGLQFLEGLRSGFASGVRPKK